MPRAKKPAQLKVIAGTDRKDRASKPPADLPLVSGMPEAPDWMPNAHAKKEWNRLAPILIANRLLTEAGLSALGHLCALHGHVVAQHAAGLSPPASTLGTLRTMYNDFGLTPAAQGKVTPAEGGGKQNPFAGNGRKKA